MPALLQQSIVLQTKQQHVHVQYLAKITKQTKANGNNFLAQPDMNVIKWPAQSSGPKPI